MTSISSIPDSPVAFNPATPISTSAFIVASAATGFITPEAGFATDGKVYFYIAKSPDGSVWEYGSGAYAYLDHSLARTTIFITSNGDQNPVTFSATPVVSVVPSSPTTLEDSPSKTFQSGTTMAFMQAAAPVGWTRITTYDDAAIRIVGSATPGSGGTNGFSTVFAQTTVGNHTLTVSEIPPHTHGIPVGVGSGLIHGFPNSNNNSPSFLASDNGAAGGLGGQAHNHTIEMDIKYVDFLIASKN